MINLDDLYSTIRQEDTCLGFSDNSSGGPLVSAIDLEYGGWPKRFSRRCVTDSVSPGKQKDLDVIE